MAKDTEKLIRQLSLISYLMAERRPVTALEIRRDVEGYSGMNEDAFARRFYADRSELESLRIQLTVERPTDGAAEQENYSLRPENFHLPPIAFTDEELAALQTALSLLDGEFAYAEPLRLALQQITWGRPSPLRAPEQRSVALGITASAGGHELSARLAKVETAIFRNKTIVFDYYTMERDETGPRRVDPYHLLFQGGQFYLLGYAHERKAIRVFRLSRIRGKVSYATKAEHDFRRPEDFDPRAYARRADWQLGDPVGVAEVLVCARIAWQIERHFGRYGEIRAIHAPDEEATGAAGGGGVTDADAIARAERLEAAHASEGDVVFATDYSSPRTIVAWVLGLGANARLLGPESLTHELQRRLELLWERHGEVFLDAAIQAAAAKGSATASRAGKAHPASERGGFSRERGGRRGTAAEEGEESPGTRGNDTAIRPERFARLVTLASILIHAGRAGEPVSIADVCEKLKLSPEELHEDVNVLNVVNFGGGSYVLYAEILETEDGEGTIEVDPEPYSDNFDRPARLLPVEGKALVAAIDLIGEHIPEGSLSSAREKIVAALGEDPMEHGLQVAHAASDDSDLARLVSTAIVEHRLIELEYFKENEDELSHRTVEPYALTNGREGWYVACFDPERDGVRHFRLDRIKRAEISDRAFEPRPEVDPAAEVDGWLRTGEVQASRTARVWVSPERARWAREARRVVSERADGSVVVELSFAGVDWLVREILKEAGDAAVLEPADAREAVLAAVGRLRNGGAVAAGV
ncbi:MAG TPA: WYL domain-containing protein [Solirubrobacteraceae bacterium]|jgi:predicted DNA-binding transcriptional regulator YafY|nr:WYL domain-containing protein [Solirubrobacteraceae bacterium]